MATITAPIERIAELLTPQQVARILQVDTKTLANWRYLGRGPAFMKDGGVVRYSRRELHTYLNRQTVITHA